MDISQLIEIAVDETLLRLVAVQEKHIGTAVTHTDDAEVDATCEPFAIVLDDEPVLDEDGLEAQVRPRCYDGVFVPLLLDAVDGVVDPRACYVERCLRSCQQ